MPIGPDSGSFPIFFIRYYFRSAWTGQELKMLDILTCSNNVLF